MYEELNKIRKRVLALSVTTTLLLIVGFVSFISAPFIGFPVFAAATILKATLVQKKKKAYNTMFKHRVVRSVLEEYIDGLDYIPESGISEETIRSTDMMRLGNIYKSEDYIRGTYKGAAFEQSDVYIAHESSDSNGSTSTTVYFHGRWMIFDFNKEFEGSTQVREKGFNYAKKKKSDWSLFKKKSETPKMIQVEMEDTEFNAAFDVFADDAHHAFYILTPHIMQAISSLRGKTKGKILMLFTGKKLHIAVNSGDSFEAPLYEAITDSVVLLTREEIGVITRFVDEMKLDQNIYKR